MAFQVSPGVQVKEIDATSVIPAVSTSIGGFAGGFNWGPVDEIRTVSSEDSMASIFSTPDSTTAKYFLTAASFLRYGNALKVVRAVGSSAKNAVTADASGTFLIKNEDDYQSKSFIGGGIADNAATGTILVRGTAATAIAVDDEFVGNTFTFKATSAGTIADQNQDIDNLAYDSGTTLVTVTTDADHGYSTGLEVTISGATDTDYNVSNAAITVTSNTTFTYSPTTAPSATSEDPTSAIVDVDFIAISVVAAQIGTEHNLDAGEALTSTISGVDQVVSLGVAGGTYADPNETEFIAKYPGVLGNSLRVEICPPDASVFNGWAYKAQFDSAPGTSDYCTNLGSAIAATGDELHIVILDEDGAFTGTPGSVLETFPYVSQASDAKDGSGTSLYYKNVINDQSRYIWFGAHNDDLSQAGTTATAAKAEGSTFPTYGVIQTRSLSGGIDDNDLAAANITAALELFEDAETVDVNLLFSFPDSNGNKDIADKLISICEARKDCMAFISPPIADTANATTPTDNVVEFANTLNSTSYASLDSGAVYVYDKFNDEYMWIGSAGLTAGLCANTDQAADAWFSPAGVNRGQLRGVVKLAHNPKQADRDTLYKARVNPLVSFPGQGTMLYGDKTLLSRPSAFDRINVRRLFMLLEKAIATASKAQLFEFNDEFTRAQFRNMVEPFLRDVKGRRGLTDFAVICDDTNNDGQVIDTNSFVADIYIKPARSINFITLNFIATRTGVDFSEVAGG